MTRDDYHAPPPHRPTIPPTHQPTTTPHPTVSPRRGQAQRSNSRAEEAESQVKILGLKLRGAGVNHESTKFLAERIQEKEREMGAKVTAAHRQLEAVSTEAHELRGLLERTQKQLGQEVAKRSAMESKLHVRDENLASAMLQLQVR